MILTGADQSQNQDIRQTMRPFPAKVRTVRQAVRLSQSPTLGQRTLFLPIPQRIGGILQVATLPSGATVIPTGEATTKVPAAIDWLSVSKVATLEAGFIGSLAFVLFGHADPNVLSLVWALGAALFGLRVTDTVANLVNVRSYLNSSTAQSAGVVPQAAGTPLVTTNVPTPPTNGAAI